MPSFTPSLAGRRESQHAGIAQQLSGRALKLTVRGDAAIVLPAIEDMIADRLGQHEVAGGDMSMLEQARALYALAEGLDLDYLYRRIVEETGNPAHLGLSRKA